VQVDLRQREGVGGDRRDAKRVEQLVTSSCDWNSDTSDCRATRTWCSQRD
jgi:hypothetical protein